jgi:hypothetical protein
MYFSFRTILLFESLFFFKSQTGYSTIIWSCHPLSTINYKIFPTDWTLVWILHRKWDKQEREGEWSKNCYDFAKITPNKDMRRELRKKSKQAVDTKHSKNSSEPPSPSFRGERQTARLQKVLIKSTSLHQLLSF